MWEGQATKLYNVSMAINQFKSLGWLNILSQHHHRRLVELIEKKLWKGRQREGEKKEARSICRAGLRTLRGRLNTGYQIWTQNKSLSSSTSSHSLYDHFLAAACILSPNHIKPATKRWLSHGSGSRATPTQLWNRLVLQMENPIPM